mmetsp:Transcript_36915/g.104172  ORF Transcript_36915/g.104172 Transcript_36915/m.104172 type:complete len:437 (-) Transcript_36915:93-1403(-)
MQAVAGRPTVPQRRVLLCSRAKAVGINATPWTYPVATPLPYYQPAQRRGCKHSRGHCLWTKATSRNQQSQMSLSQPGVSQLEPADVVRQCFDCFNRRDLAAMMELYAPDGVYHNLAYESPAVGRKRTGEFIRGFTESLPDDVVFVIDDITSGLSDSVGVIWHMEISDVEIPMGKGISFYKLNSQGQIAYARECPEHFAKLAFAAPPMLSLAAPLLRGIGPIFSSPGVSGTQDWWTLRGDNDRPAEASPLSSSVPGSQEMTDGSPAGSIGSTGLSTVHGDSDPPDITLPVEMAGKWSKVPASSDLRSYEDALEMMGIRGIQKTTAQLIDGVELSVTNSDFTIRFLTIVPNFKVTEPYKLGREVEMGRRDLRNGWQRGTATLLPGGVVELSVALGPADGWAVTETFWRSGPDELSVHSNVTQGDRQVGFTTVYRRGHA